MNSYFFIAALTKKCDYGEIVRNSEDLKTGPTFQKWQEMSKAGFKTAQQINSDFCAVSNLHFRGTEQSCLK